jgi:hypothetical protein
MKNRGLIQHTLVTHRRLVQVIESGGDVRSTLEGMSTKEVAQLVSFHHLTPRRGKGENITALIQNVRAYYPKQQR